MPNTTIHRGLRGIALGAALLLSGCLSAPLDRADRAAEARIEQAAEEARRIAQVASERVDDVRAAAVADVAARVSAERAATLAEVDARLTRQREQAAADAGRLLADLDARMERQRAAATADLRALVEESLPLAAGKAAEAASAALLSRLDSWTAPKPSGAATAPTGQPEGPTDPKWELWAGVVALALTAGKTAWRVYRTRKAAGA